MLVYLLFILGLVLLVVGGDWLVKGSVGLAEKLSIPPLIIGLTIVAFGTSAPELVISLRAALSGNGGIAVGNVVGSNIANVLLVLGVPALFASIACVEKGIKTSLFFLIGLTVAFMLQMAYGPINRIDGLLLLTCLAAFLTQQILAARRHKKSEAGADYKEEVGNIPQSGLIISGFMAAGLIALPLGATFTVDSAVDIATRWNISKEVIGLTIVAIGTSLPELATGIMAARQKNASVAVGNIIGSNLFNIAAIMGVTATVTNVPVGDHIINFDMWVMLAVTLLLIALPVFKVTLGRAAGCVLTVAYVAYLFTTAAH
jgi:cation:H+ antiporter